MLFDKRTLKLLRMYSVFVKPIVGMAAQI